MRLRSRSQLRRVVAVAAGLTLVVAACGNDDGDATETTTAPTTAAPVTTTETGEGGSGVDCPEPDSSIDAEEGVGAGRFLADLACALDNPLAAEGDPIVIGWQNSEGDPNGSFPEYTEAALAMEAFINTELGGLGADIQNGVPGRPIQIEVCKMAVTPDDSQRCANELIAKDVDLSISTFNFFGNHFPIYAAAGVPVVVTTPITIGDFTSPGVFSIGGGGGCLGVHTGLVEFATNDLGGKRIGVPWADTPPGVVCYNDLEKKPLEVIKGVEPGASARAGTVPDLEFIGVPMKPATPDTSPIVAQVLDFEPDTIIFSAQASDCWNLVDGMGRSGWTPDQIPLVLAGSCLDFDAMRAAGDLAVGVYLITAGGALTNPLDTIENPRDAFEAEVYQTKLIEYGLPENSSTKSGATGAVSALFGLWELSSQLAVSGAEITGESLAAAFGATENQHLFGSTPISCATAPEPYVAVCNSTVSAVQWDGDKLVPVRPKFTGIDLVAGTALKPAG